MNCFLSDIEKQQIHQAMESGHPLLSRFYTALENRVKERAASPGLFSHQEDVQWWYPTAEYLSDGAMLYALSPDEKLAAWLKDVTLGIIRRPLSDWVGPWFRDHTATPAMGHLETAHLCWGISIALDLAEEIFSQMEKEEVREALLQKGTLLCQQWLKNNSHLANWRGIMASGFMVSASVLGNRELLELGVQELRLCTQAFQADGSYAESLQYGNYLSYALMLAYESVKRKQTDLAEKLDISSYAKGTPWIAASMMYAKPLSGWGSEFRARAVNFNDSAAIFRPSGDILLHIASRQKEKMPKEAGLARWLFDTYYAPVPEQSPHHLASFGFCNDWGFLTIPLLLQSTEKSSPKEAGLPEYSGFSNGNIIIRDAWEGGTVLAMQGGSEPLHGPGHLHGDLNSFMLSHKKERLLIDPGHSCYRNLIHGLESASQTHNTCTFLINQDKLGLQEDLAKAKLLEQSSKIERREIVQGNAGPPVAARGKRLILTKKGKLTVAGSEAAALYGKPIESFSRFWFFMPPHILFVVDWITASAPVTTVWNWLLNNRDGASVVNVHSRHHISLQRNGVGLSIFHGSDCQFNGPVYSYAHDAYHPEPNHPGEGKPGSGLLYRWTEKQPQKTRCIVHAFIFDNAGQLHPWKFENTDASYILRKNKQYATLSIEDEKKFSIKIETHENHQWHLIQKDQQFQLL